jgi:hypothetical protein
MKPLRIAIASILSLMFVFAGLSCSKSGSNSGNNQCNFSTDAGNANAGATVVYGATGKGTTTISSLTYQGVNGLVKVNSPTLPWSVSLDFPNGGAVNLSAVGTTTSGSTITLAWGISYSPNNIQVDTTACGH